MDASSPLAAMHPAPPPSWGRPSHAHFTSNPFAGPMSIREQLQRSKPDYFNLKSVRGSSPTASLAADLSQNFRIDNDASPPFPTPRRALFTSNMMGNFEDREYITTPPLPATSSPVPMHDAMDISPLPQKDAFGTTIEITSPTPISSPEDEMMMESPIPNSMPRHFSLTLEPSKPLIDSRRRTALRRPSLTRAKGHSTSALHTRLHPESQISSFRFGSECRFGGASASMAPSELFQDSPPQRPQTANSPSEQGSVRPKPQFASLTGTRDIRNGSPVALYSRRPSNPFIRPRRQYRRSLSMFESPADIMKAKATEACTQHSLQPVTDVEEAKGPVLPHFFPEGQSDSIPRVSRATFLDIIDGKYNEHYTQKIVIDCRFEYEYEGGHIDGAINYNDKELLTRHLFDTPMDGNTLLIFHCEYSAHRAPMMARHVRSEDRTANAEFYPRLTYPEVYILEGGYSEFFDQHRDRCYPQAYVEMGAEEHAFTCERELGKLQQKRKGLGRAKTFAFGHRESMVDASPTAPGRLMGHQSPDMMIGNSPILGNNRSPARRLASY
ncbi:Uu.00g042250.m01.CDS01 [Anthostomella pinea]|uniref:M-phase inducer phosphatase n=1 Tax=Anthostomella pinea TaxID=933095 RepID=A0AAI8VB82_9PEZI|nr:Uu.00g042250.m01.CDS01 [Anthostomella pinea]